MDGAPPDIGQRAPIVDRLPEAVQHAPEEGQPDGDLQGTPGVDDRRAPGETSRRAKGDPANGLGVEVRGDLDGDRSLLPRHQLVPERRQTAVETDVHDVAVDREEPSGPRTVHGCQRS
jgi:hypothetical protein